MTVIESTAERTVDEERNGAPVQDTPGLPFTVASLTLTSSAQKIGPIAYSSEVNFLTGAVLNLKHAREPGPRRVHARLELPAGARPDLQPMLMSCGIWPQKQNEKPMTCLFD